MITEQSAARSNARADDRQASSPAYLLADHLDAMLAAGEDLLACGYDVPKPAERVTADAIADAIEAEHMFVAEIRALEAALISRVLQARVRAAELAKLDARFRAIVSLFIGGTRAFIDAIDDLGERARARAQFNGADDPLSYFRSRAMLAADAPGLDLIERLTVTEDFLITERIKLGPLLDLAATFLTTLELHYDLFEAADTAAEMRAVGQREVVADAVG